MDAGQVINCLAEHVKAPIYIMAVCGYGTDYEKYLLTFGAYAVIMLAILESIGLNLFPAPYGWYATRSSGPMIPAKVAWFLSQLPCLALPVWVFLTSVHSITYFANYLLLEMFIFHYLVKIFIHPLLVRVQNPMPFIPFTMASFYCAVNGYLQAKYLVSYVDDEYTWTFGTRFSIGTSLFLVGMGINLHGDFTLATLRARYAALSSVTTASKPQHEKSSIAADADGSGGDAVMTKETREARNDEERMSAIPHGGLFDYVSCANYFGELVEWFGWALAAWSLPAFAHFLFSCTNLIPRAMQHHRDYLTKFKESYPRNRYAVIPGIL